MESTDEKYRALAQLRWQVELGATDAVRDTPQSWYELAQKAPVKPVKTLSSTQATRPKPVPPAPLAGPVEAATTLAAQAADLESLRNAMAGYGHCDLRQGAKNLVFSDGNPTARVMIIGEAPGRDEDIQGKPFVGAAGQFLDKMFAAIDLGRSREEAQNALYITNVIPWRPPGNRDPDENEIAMMVPFLRRHIELIGPKIIVLVGNIACAALLGERGITKLRGTWRDYDGIPLLPMVHPAYVLRRPEVKRDVWQDLKSISKRLTAEAS